MTMLALLLLACVRSPEVLAPPTDDVIYLAMVDRFADGDPRTPGAVDPDDPAAFHGGDLRGLRKNLDHIEALGARTLWITPIFELQDDRVGGHGAFHGYWTTDPGRVEDRFGDTRELKRLRRALDRRDMRLVLDVVWNHVGYNAPLTRQRPAWFHGLGDIEDWSDLYERVQHNVHGLPDLAIEREPVYLWLRDHTLSWIEVARPDGLRVDAVRHMPLTSQARLSEDLRAAAGPELWLVGEAFDGDPVQLAVALKGGGFSAVFDFPLQYAMVDVFCKDRPVGRLASTLSLDRVYGDALREASLVTFLDNHDLPRVHTACGGEVGRVSQALAFLFLARGTPSLTWGTEIGLQGAGEPENRGDMRFDVQSPVGDALRRAVDLRRRHPALQTGVTVSLALDEDLYTSARITADEAAIIAVNRGDRGLPLGLPDAWRGLGRSVSGVVVGPDGTMVALPQPIDPTTPVAVPARSLTVLFAAPNAPGGFQPLVDAAWAEPALREVVLQVESPLAEGETLLWVGAGPELGHWSPERGVPVVEGRAAVKVPVGSTLASKLVIRQADGSVRWEQGEDRYVFVGAGADTVILPATWRGP